MLSALFGQWQTYMTSVGGVRAAAPGGLLLTAATLALAASPQTEWSHHCSACGKCCNSPPQLAVSELFHHQDTFFGCLTVQRLPRPAASDVRATAAFDELAASLWHRLPSAHADADDVLLATRGLDLGLSERCPALADDQRCSLHERGKPAICRVVPLDFVDAGTAPNTGSCRHAAQEARYFGSDCIQPGVRPGLALMTRRLSVVDSEALAALAEHRRLLAAERRTWGDAVFQLLAKRAVRLARRARAPAGRGLHDALARAGADGLGARVCGGARSLRGIFGGASAPGPAPVRASPNRRPGGT